MQTTRSDILPALWTVLRGMAHGDFLSGSENLMPVRIKERHIQIGNEGEIIKKFFYLFKIKEFFQKPAVISGSFPRRLTQWTLPHEVLILT